MVGGVTSLTRTCESHHPHLLHDLVRPGRTPLPQGRFELIVHDIHPTEDDPSREQRIGVLVKPRIFGDMVENLLR